jgi:hypothetical protein
MRLAQRFVLFFLSFTLPPSPLSRIETKASFDVNSPIAKSVTMTFFLQEFVPHIEAKYRIRRG